MPSLLFMGSGQRENIAAVQEEHDLCKETLSRESQEQTEVLYH